MQVSHLTQAEDYFPFWLRFASNFRDIGWLAVDMGRQAGIEFAQERRPKSRPISKA
jgi:hypothetical protein